MMGQIGIWQIAIVLVFAINVFAFWKLLPRAGVSKWIALVTIIPLLAMVVLWFVGFKKWPGDKH